MLNKAILGILLLVSAVFFSNTSHAQTTAIDTIIVNLSGETTSNTNKKTPEVTPVLDLGAMRDQAREDSLKIAKIQKEKDAIEKKRMEDLKDSRLKEKEEKEKEQKELAQKRKEEKETREKELENKKKEKEIAAELQKKKEKEESEKEKLAAKAKKLEEETAKKAAQEELEKKKAAEHETLATEKPTAIEESEDEAPPEDAATEEQEPSITEVVVKEDYESTTEETTPEEEKQSEITQSSTAPENEADEELNLPQVPKGVEQKDNNYGTVRLAYDDNAASFLLSIPTETKMHYHKEHSEHIMLIEGEGMVLIGYKTVKLKKNELLFITKGTPHKIINNGKDKLKVLSIQSPFYDGSDIIILE